MSGIVWLLQEPPKDKARFDIAGAEAFGRIVSVLVAGEQPGFRPAEAYDRIAKKLESLDPEEDFLLYAGGDPLTLLITGAVLAAREDVESVRFLRFHRDRSRDGRLSDDGRYVEVRVPVYVGDNDDGDAA